MSFGSKSRYGGVDFTDSTFDGGVGTKISAGNSYTSNDTNGGCTESGDIQGARTIFIELNGKTIPDLWWGDIVELWKL